MGRKSTVFKIVIVTVVALGLTVYGEHTGANNHKNSITTKASIGVVRD